MELAQVIVWDFLTVLALWGYDPNQFVEDVDKLKLVPRPKGELKLVFNSRPAMMLTYQFQVAKSIREESYAGLWEIAFRTRLGLPDSWKLDKEKFMEFHNSFSGRIFTPNAEMIKLAKEVRKQNPNVKFVVLFKDNPSPPDSIKKFLAVAGMEANEFVFLDARLGPADLAEEIKRKTGANAKNWVWIGGYQAKQSFVLGVEKLGVRFIDYFYDFYHETDTPEDKLRKDLKKVGIRLN